MSNYAELSRHPAVKQVNFVGGGCAKVVLHDNFRNNDPRFNVEPLNGTSVIAPFFRTAEMFVNGAEEMVEMAA